MWHMWGKREKCAGFCWEILKESNNLEEISRWIILKERNRMGRHGLDSSGWRIGMNGRLL
jgi:hypothetical protein